MSVIEREANLSIYPISKSGEVGHVAVGDMHGNALKLIYTLIEENILDIDQGDYTKIKTIYDKKVGDLTKSDIAQFKSIVESCGVNRKKSLTLIGDELADRGKNDYFTLMVFKKLHESAFDFDVVISNHANEFINDYERSQFTGKARLGKGQGRSLGNMHKLIHRRIIEEEDVREMVNSSYKERVKGISYTLSDDGNITLFTHAPVGLETVESIANFFKIPYKDNTREALINTIDEVNEKINQLFNEKKLGQLFTSQRYSAKKGPIPLSKPLYRLIWNRFVGDELRTKPSGNFKVSFVHGHIGSKTLENQNRPITSHSNLDNSLGKGDISGKQSHRTRRSEDKTWLQIEKENICIEDDISLLIEPLREYKTYLEETYTIRPVSERIPTTKLYEAKYSIITENLKLLESVENNTDKKKSVEVIYKVAHSLFQNRSTIEKRQSYAELNIWQKIKQFFNTLLSNSTKGENTFDNLDKKTKNYHQFKNKYHSLKMDFDEQSQSDNFERDIGSPPKTS